MRGGGLIILFSCAVVQAVANVAPGSSNAYSAIQERNAFGLKAPTPTAQKEPVPEQPTSKVYLTGITTILGSKQALLLIVPPNAKSGEQSESVILREGQRQGPVEVLQINEDARTVRIVNSGKPATLTFDEMPPATMAQAPPNAANQGASPGFGSGYGSGMRPPGTTNAPTSPPNPMAGMRSRFPGRTERETATPSSETNTPPPPLPSSTPLPNQQLSPEERQTLLQVEQQLQQQERSADQPAALPPTGTSQQYFYEQNPPPPRPMRPPYPLFTQ